MISEFGHYALCLALLAAAIQATVPLVGVSRGEVSAMRVADGAAHVQFLAVGIAFAALINAYVTSDFSLTTVALNSHSAKPMLYKVTGVWANHEGSMLLWVFILALFGVLISIFGGVIPTATRACVLAVQGMIGTGFFLFILITSNPFERLANPPLDGQGMNPLLQDPGVAFHPPLLYVGYVGFSTAFSFAVAALIMGRVDPSWARWLRPWVLLAWSGLTAGIALGSWWAYYELGWGGFWFWDPVENASFMPWLLGTALLHSATVVEKRSSLLKWTILLSILTFGLSLIGTFLVRSGILSSVHAFANDPERGVFILALLVISLGGALSLFAWRAGRMRDTGEFALASRESGLLINNFLLAAACGVVFVGTLYPLFLDAFTGQKVTVGAPYFNKSFLPIFAAVILVAGIGPFMAWKKADKATVLSRASTSLIVAFIIVMAIVLALDLRHPLGTAGIGMALWLGVATIIDFIRRIGLPKIGINVALRRLAGLPASAWALYFGHLGLAVAVAGVVAVSAWKIEAIQVQKLGESVRVGAYAFTLIDRKQARGPNYQSSLATVKVERDGKLVTLMFPERRWYPVEQQQTTEAAISTRWHGDLYAVMGDASGEDGVVTRYYYNPGVPWMWLGALMIAFSGLLSLMDRRFRVGAPGRAGRSIAAQPAE